MIVARVLTWFAFRPMRIVYALSATAVLLMVLWAGLFAVDKWQAEAEVVRLEQELAEREQRLAAIQLMAAQTKEALAAADAARLESERQARYYRKLRDRAAASGGEEDGPIAPVLRDVLDGIGRMRDKSTTPDGD